MTGFAGWQKHLHLAKEDTWGQFPGSPQRLYLPYAEYDVAVRVESAQAELFTGQRQRRHRRQLRARLTGALRCPLFSYHVQEKSVAEHLLEWLTSAPASLDLQSCSAEVSEAGADDKRHLGLRPRSGIVSGDAESGRIEISLELEGKEEQGGIAPPPVPVDAPAPVEFLFHDSVFSLNSVELPLQSFALRISNGLRSYHNNSYWPSVLAAGVRDVALEFSLFKTDATFDQMRRLPPEELTAQLVLRGAHGGTGPDGTQQSVIAFDFARLSFADAVEEGALGDLWRQRPRFVALKPDSAASEVTVSFGAE